MTHDRSSTDKGIAIALFDVDAQVRDIGDTMGWNLLSSTGLVSPRRALRSARDSLVLSLSQPQERRGEFRLFNSTAGTRVMPTGEVLLNISRSGIAVGVRKKCTFARGEYYRVILDDGMNRAAVEGKVCWTRSTWPRDSIASNSGEYFQAAGLAVAPPLSSEQERRWQALRELVQDGSAALDVKIAPLR